MDAELEVSMDEKKAAENVADEIVVPDELCVKALGGKRLGVYLILFGDQKHPDLQGTWFTPETKAVDTIYKSVGVLPAFYHHGHDHALGASVIGKTDVFERDSTGWWIETSLDLKSAFTQSEGDGDWLQEQLRLAEK